MIPFAQPRIAQFENLGFGMFIHWGLYSQLGKGEWIQKLAQIPKDEYARLLDTFTAENLDFDRIATLAKRAGMKYIVLTTRHHEGFSLYDTKGLSDFDVMHSPAGRDLVQEFVTACRREGLLPFFYHTTIDWSVDSYQTDFPSYLKYLRESIKILCTHYGPIGGFWFDGNWDKPDADWEEDQLYGMIRRYQPQAILVNNTGIHKQGETGNPELDSVTFEQGRPQPLNREGAPKYLAAEMCQTLNAHWSVGKQDLNYKSTAYIIENLCACRKVGANYLLNIGPYADGSIAKIQEGMLEVVGDWVSVFAPAVYKTRPSPIQGRGKDFCLHLDEKHNYLFIHDLSVSGDANVTLAQGGKGPRIFEKVTKKVKSIAWMDNREALSFVQDAANGYISVFATGYPYGTSLVVRVAEVVYE